MKTNDRKLVMGLVLTLTIAVTFFIALAMQLMQEGPTPVLATIALMEIAVVSFSLSSIVNKMRSLR